MPGMGRSNIHLDILMGRDETLDAEDIFLGWSAISPRVDTADIVVRNGAGLPSESSLGNGKEGGPVKLVSVCNAKNRVPGVQGDIVCTCLPSWSKSVRRRHTLIIASMSIPPTTDPFDSVLQPRSSTSEPSLHSGPLPLFDHHLKVLTDSFLSFFQERYVSPCPMY